MKDHIYPEEFKDRAITRLLNRILIDELKSMPIKDETAAAIQEQLPLPFPPKADGTEF